MRPVNLIPPEELRGERAPLRTGILSYAIVGFLAVALAGTYFFVLAGNSITEKEAELASLEARQLVADQRAEELAPYGEFATMAESRRATISSLADSRFDWERVLRELALVMPEDVWLDSLSGSVAGAAGAVEEDAAAAAAPADSSITGPSLQISGCADGQVAVAGFVAALKDIDGVTRVGMQQSALGDLDAGGAGAATTEPTAGGATGGCQTRSSIAAFQITVAFDAVPPPAAPATSSTTTTATTPAAAPAATDDAGTAEAEAEQQAASDSASKQSSDAKGAAEAVGVG